eukprot:ANDGO_07480.mRNA.1 hypothetical protein
MQFDRRYIWVFAIAIAAGVFVHYRLGAVHTQSSVPIAKPKAPAAVPEELRSRFYMNTSLPFDPLFDERLPFKNFAVKNMPFVDYGIRFLELWQNPKSCDGVKFALWSFRGQISGLGSDLHTISWAMQTAITTNRILHFLPTERWLYSSPEFCEDIGLHCYIFPITKCELPPKDKYDYTRLPTINSPQASDARVVVIPCCYVSPFDFDIPNVFLSDESIDWKQIDERVQVRKTWWRTVFTGFLWARLRPEMHSWMRDFIKASVRESDLAKDAVCIHIRHGDKAREMQLHPLRDYVEGAARIVEQLGIDKRIFLSTDDENVILELGNFKDWEIFYLNQERHNNMSPMQQADAMKGTKFLQISLANLLFQTMPSCRGWVQTTGSNWCRLINEVRRLQGAEYLPFVDLEYGEV